MKVAIIGSRGYPYVYSGYETLVKELGERLVLKGVEVRVYCHRPLFSHRPRYVNGIELIYMPAIETKVLSQLSNSFFCFLHCCFSKVEVVFVVNTANGPFGLLTLLFRKKTVINLDGIEWQRPKWKGFGSKYFFWASKLATKFYDHLVNDSDEMKKLYQELFNAESTVIAYGAKIRYSQKQELIKKWQLAPNDYYIIVGRLIPDNNDDLIIKGFLLSGSVKRLVIVGDVPYLDKYATSLKEMANYDDRLVFTGYVKDQELLAELYHNSYCYFHGHEYGGTNPTMLKAMAYGCSILALNTRFNREMLSNGEFGYFFEKNVNAVREAVEWSEKEEETMFALKRKVRNGITEKYDWDEVTKKYLEVFGTD